MTPLGSGPERAARLLVVEDDPGTARFLAMALERAGHRVEVAPDAFRASDALAAGSFDALLVDIGLQGLSGFDLVHEVKGRRPDVPIALMTADASMDVAVRALRSEVDDFLPKPIEPAALVEQVERLLALGRRSRRTERVLAVGAHPDDVEIGVGGVLLAHRQAGDGITVVTMTRGARGGDHDARAEESARAAALLGADLLLHDLEDTHVPQGDPTVALLEQAVAAVTPTILYTHSVHDLHQDHRATHQAALVAGRGVPSVYCYESPSATVDFRPARFVAIDAFVDGKLELIEQYRSQADVRWYLDPDLVRSTGRYWGRYGDTRYCEPLEVVRDRSGDRSPVRSEGTRAPA